MGSISHFFRHSSRTDRSDLARTVTLILFSLLGSYAIANAVDPMRSYLSATFGLAETGRGAWWIVRTTSEASPLFVVLLLAIAAVTATRNGGLLWSCVLPTTLLHGMAVAIFGLESGLLEVVEPSVPLGIVTGTVGWLVARGLRRGRDRSSNGLQAVLFGRWNDQRRIGTLLGSVVLLLFTGYAVVAGAELMTVYLERTIGRPRSGILFFLELYLVRAPLVVVFLLGIGAGNAVRGGDVVTSSALPTAILLGMAFATFGFPPLLLNVFYQGVPAGILLGAVGWLAGIGAVKLYHNRRPAVA